MNHATIRYQFYYMRNRIALFNSLILLLFFFAETCTVQKGNAVWHGPALFA